ncbi:MAG: uroporphyrinogen decarboxylase [Chloroflexota bacterium]
MKPAPEECPGRFLRACRLEAVDRTPVWFMRQAGRSLPEYREIREKHDLVAITQQPELCAEVTLQPVRRLGVDAAILFADIMTPLLGVGLDVRIVEHVGPVLDEPICRAEDLERLRPLEPEQDVPYVLRTLQLLRTALPAEVGLIGFAGAPFTLASYLVEGRPSRTFARTKQLMYTAPALWAALMSRLAAIVSSYLAAQVQAGAQVVQLFDSWAGCLSVHDYRAYVLPYSAQILRAVAGTGVPAIHFGTGTSAMLEAMREAGGDVIGVDWRIPLDVAWQRIGYDRGIQGNLDPLALMAPWDVLASACQRVLAQGQGHAGHVFNLGHGVDPSTSPDTLARVVRLVHGEDA